MYNENPFNPEVNNSNPPPITLRNASYYSCLASFGSASLFEITGSIFPTVKWMMPPLLSSFPAILASRRNESNNPVLHDFAKKMFWCTVSGYAGVSMLSGFMFLLEKTNIIPLQAKALSIGATYLSANMLHGHSDKIAAGINNVRQSIENLIHRYRNYGVLPEQNNATVPLVEITSASARMEEREVAPLQLR